MAASSLTDALRETLAVFAGPEAGAPLTTNEVADRLDLGRRSTYSRLERLVERDLVETKKVGARGRVWWRPPAAAPAYVTAGTEEALRIERVRSLVGAVEEYAIVTLDPDGRVRTWNPGAVRIAGYEGEEIVGEHVATFYTEADRRAGVPADHLAEAESDGAVEYRGWRVRADGSRFRARVAITAIRDEGGALEGFAVVTRDLTDRRLHERARPRERDRLERVLETSPIAIGVFDADGHALRVNEQFSDFVGMDGGDPDDYALDDEPILDGRGEAIPAPERPAARALSTGEAVTDERVRVNGPDGGTRWLSVNATPFEDEGEGVVVTMADVTQLSEQAQKLERQRDEVEAELQHVFDRVDDAFWGLDDEFRFTYINDYAAELLGRSAAELLGAKVWEEFAWLEDVLAKEKFEEAMATGQALHYEDYLEATDRWYDVRLYPSETGLSVYYRDVTERKEREQALAASERHNRALVENFPNGAVSLFDEDLRYIVVGGTLFEELGVTTEEMEGLDPGAVLPPALYDRIEPQFRAVFDGEAREFEVELGDSVREFRTRPVRDEHGEIVAGLGMSQDVTERRGRERELERYETILETVDDGIYAVDSDATFVVVNDAFCDLVGYDRDELLGRPASTIHEEEITPRAEQFADEVAAGERDLASIELDVYTKTGEAVPVESRFAPYPIEDGFGRCGVVRDMTQRIERERELERYVGIVDAVGEAVYELDAQGRITFVNEAMADYSGYSESELLGQHASIGMEESAVARAESHIARLFANDEAVRTTLEYDLKRKDGERIPVENRISVRTDEDGRFAGSAGLLWDVSERRERERELERQRNRLGALDDLNGVVREITDAVIEQPTREEIERIVCERLAGTDSYSFAWIGDVDGQTDTVTLRAEAGVEGYLDDVTITVDPDDERSRGPTGRALREREIQVSQDVENESSHDPWREVVDEYGFQSSAAIPIVHDGTLFGALNVYADRPHAFSEAEQEVIGQLGEVVGHAIAAVERKQALMSDEVVEVEFRVKDAFEGLDVGDPDGPAAVDGSISLDRSVPIGGGSYLVYGTATGDAMAVVDALVASDAFPYWASANVLRRRDGSTRFELGMDEPPVLSAVTNHGGYVDEAVVEDGDLYARATSRPAPTSARSSTPSSGPTPAS